MLLRSLIRELPPAYFALVMATGIVSIAAYGLGPASIGWGLFGLNLVLYTALAVLHGLRLMLFPQRCIVDLFDPSAGPGYFTWIAATAVLGSQCLVLAHAAQVATALFVFAVVLWLLLNYAVFAALALRRHKQALDVGINGGWLLAVVAMQGLAVLATHLAGGWAQPVRLELHFAALVLWLAGGMLYLWLAALIFYRYYFFALGPGDLVPTYWINMGAMAISTLAGSLLIAGSSGPAPYLQSLRPFLEGFTLFYWAGGTWWLPLLVILGVWRHVIRGYRLVYDPLYWGMVFPLGMYAVATEHMSRSMGLAFLRPISIVFLYIALLAWGVTALGLVVAMLTGVRRFATQVRAAARD
ncbi:tellurite resistance/C4-dicarboxylate transporter family protein [Salinisphaera hydrothermalis]|uniref:tellurite resistance/C4-dicarboxylate transporter family protein n=1 Tax=Salinisphaera hydrothermalis TaxID=563188 RepID=UPI00334273CA